MYQISDKEQKILDALAEAWNNFCELEEQHSMDRQYFVDGIHLCEYAVTMRWNRKNYPEIFSNS